MDRIKEFIISNRYIIVLVLIIILLIFFLLINFDKEESVREPEIVTLNNPKEEKEIKKVTVDIKGEVKVPGVYDIKENSHVLDVIKVAGGLTDKADTSYINLSKKVSDEMVIIIYSKEEIDKMKSGEDNIVIVEGECKCPSITNDGCIDKDNIVTNKKEEVVNNNSGKVNINSDDVNELTRLSGIGQKKAMDIIEYRKNNGDFTNIEDIKNVKGIGDAIYSKIKDNITI